MENPEKLAIHNGKKSMTLDHKSLYRLILPKESQELVMELHDHVQIHI